MYFRLRYNVIHDMVIPCSDNIVSFENDERTDQFLKQTAHMFLLRAILRFLISQLLVFNSNLYLKYSFRRQFEYKCL